MKQLRFSCGYHATFVEIAGRKLRDKPGFPDVLTPMPASVLDKQAENAKDATNLDVGVECVGGLGHDRTHEGRLQATDGPI